MSQDTNEVKVCKHCQSEIPKKAKVCPQCRKKQGGILKWVIIAIIAFVIMGAVSSDSAEEEPKKVENSSIATSENVVKENKTEKAEENVKTIFSVGETAELNGVQVTMLSIEESNGANYVNPSEGNIFVLVEFEIVNNTDEDVAISSMMSFEAYADDYVLNYSLSALMARDGNQLDGTIAAGKKMKGWIGWEVPVDYQNIEIHFKDSVWSKNDFVFISEK